jgi:SPP1 gp7 family putative phage head morphogenesis protein
MDKDKWQVPRRIEHTYSWAINALMDKIFANFDYINPFDYIDRIEEFVASKAFYHVAENIAHKMITSVYNHNARTWKEAAARGTRGKEIYQAIQKQMQGSVGDKVYSLVDYNAYLITSTPLNISREITKYVLEQQQRGRRSEDISDDLAKRLPGIKRSRVNLIARTETSKASSALTRAQSHDLGIQWFEWITSKDARVRKSHDNLDHVLMSYYDLPSPEALVGEKNVGKYGPGDIYNCRCYAAPVINANYINFPHKIYSNGIIRTITKNNFKELVG